jgi:hypothetical protein
LDLVRCHDLAERWGWFTDAPTAAKMWNNLRTIYQCEGMQSMIMIRNKILSIKYAGLKSGPQRSHLDMIDGYAGDLKRGNDVFDALGLLCERVPSPQ